MKTNFHFGYGSLEDFVAAVDQGPDLDGRPIAPTLNCLFIDDPGRPNKIGISTNDQVVMVSATQGEELHYCRIKVGIEQLLNGSHWGPREEVQQRAEQAKQAYEMIQDWLKAKGYRLRPALIAMPRDFQYLDGWPNFLGWNQATKTYFVKTEQEAPDAASA